MTESGKSILAAIESGRSCLASYTESPVNQGSKITKSKSNAGKWEVSVVKNSTVTGVSDNALQTIPCATEEEADEKFETLSSQLAELN